MSEAKTAAETIAALSKAVQREHVKQKEAKSKKTGYVTKIDFIEWHTAVRLLNEICPDWNGRVTQIVSEAGRVAVVYEISIPCTDAVVVRQAIGNEDDDMEGYGDPFSNAEAMAFKRAAAKFGVGLDLYRKDSQNAPQRAPQARTETVPVRQIDQLKPTFDTAPDEGDDFDRIPSGNGSAASEKQVNAIYAIGKAVKHWSNQQVEDRCVEVFGVVPNQLTKQEASQFIKQLQEA